MHPCRASWRRHYRLSRPWSVKKQAYEKVHIILACQKTTPGMERRKSKTEGWVGGHEWLWQRCWLLSIISTVEPVLRDHPFCPTKTVSHRQVVSLGRKTNKFYQCVTTKTVIQDEWSLMAEAARDRFYCIHFKSCYGVTRRMWMLMADIFFSIIWCSRDVLKKAPLCVLQYLVCCPCLNYFGHVLGADGRVEEEAELGKVNENRRLGRRGTRS